jgi:3-methyladenine DNA glycosylase AlkD
MARFGIVSRKVFGVGAAPLRSMAKQIGKNHTLAGQLWKSGYLEARILASLIDEPAKVTPAQMDRWVKDFDNWAVCDACCGVLFDKTPFAVSKAFQWSRDKREFVRRAGFVMMAELAVHEKRAPDTLFERFFPSLKRGCTDERNFVKKAVNWAVRQIGKRNSALNKKAIALAREMRGIGTTSSRWIAADALRELTSSAVRRRLAKK